MIPRLEKEVCSCCSKFINIGQSITECDKCNIIIHTKCFKTSKFILSNNAYYCKNCESLVHVKYNPFKSSTENYSQNKDTHSYNEELSDIFDSLNLASLILDNCCSIDTDDFNTLLTNKKLISPHSFLISMETRPILMNSWQT